MLKKEKSTGIFSNIRRHEKKIFYFLLFSHVYCLISGWFNGGDKINFPGQYFWHFLAWWCTWNSILTLGFILWKLIRRPKNNTYSYQIFSLIVKISNIMTMLIYGLGLIIWLITGLTTYWGITSRTTKLVPIPNHRIGEMQTSKVIQWWLYSPLWHFIAPAYFLVWFFHHERTDLLKKRLKLTILLCFTQPVLYFVYGYFRSKLGDKEYFKKFNARWTLPFLSSRKMSEKLGIDNNYRFVWKIILVIFWFGVFSLLVYLILRYRKNIKRYLSSKKRALTRKKREVYGSRFIGKRKNDRGGSSCQRPERERETINE